MTKYYITGTRRGLGAALAKEFDVCDTLAECDVFINCKHDGFEQVEMLYDAAKLNKKIINIGSHASDYPHLHKYAVTKRALENANNPLFVKGIDTCIVNFGYFDSPRSDNHPGPKLSIDYCVGVIKWILEQPHAVKAITVVPK